MVPDGQGTWAQGSPVLDPPPDLVPLPGTQRHEVTARNATKGEQLRMRGITTYLIAASDEIRHAPRQIILVK